MAVLEPCFLSVAEAAEQIRQHALTALDLARSCVAEIDRIEPEIGAWVTIDREGVLRKAATLDREARDGRFRGLLHGIPLGIKDVFYTAGMRTTGGHAPMANFVPEFDSAMVEQLRRTRRIVLSQTILTI
jgi:aspartyl-tRNA(Asn)/glutamyl-tRNA(Gln) amidotransferase subunit A